MREALGILSLGDLPRDQRTGRLSRPVDRMAEILGYAVLADELGLDVFGVRRWPGWVECGVRRRVAEERVRYVRHDEAVHDTAWR